jgi:tetratricopeptide (TPR) repeat protein
MNPIFDQILRHLELPSEDCLPHSQAAEFYYRRGLRREFFGLIQGAIEAYNFAILQDPTHANAYFNRGLLFKSSNKIREALQDLSKASDLYFEQMNCENYRKAKLALNTL